MITMKRLHFKGEIYVEIDDVEYCCYTEAEAEYSYDPGCYRTKNGDGWPPSEDLEVDYIDIIEVTRVEDDLQFEPTNEMEDLVERHLNNMPYEEWNNWYNDD